ncbi:MAG: alpha/beta fold hydrolase [Alphaproteobacteria bacterium]|nr:alpha/beta fold hydrolase [Alphaproteobacteria bacterium]
MLAPMQERLEAEKVDLSLPANAARLQIEISKAVFTSAQRFIAGVRAYQNHPARRDVSEAPVIWQSGTTKLRDYAPDLAGKAPVVFVVPSLVNRFTILDLDQDHSLLRALVAEGLRPLVVDWDSPGEEEKEFTLTDYIARRLIPALEFISDEKTPCAVLGYCMGGLLALALALLRPPRVRSLVLMATPWDMSGGSEEQTWLASQMQSCWDQTGLLPVAALQVMFASLQPAQVVMKFARFSLLDPASPASRRFVMTEDWLNDGVPLAAPVARECLQEWYGENRVGRIQWRVAGKLIDPRVVDVPTYVVVPGKDRLVAPESSLPLARLIRSAALHTPMLGHIGLLTSDAAPQKVWRPLTHWLLSH